VVVVVVYISNPNRLWSLACVCVTFRYGRRPGQRTTDVWGPSSQAPFLARQTNPIVISLGLSIFMSQADSIKGENRTHTHTRTHPLKNEEGKRKKERKSRREKEKDELLFALHQKSGGFASCVNKLQTTSICVPVFPFFYFVHFVTSFSPFFSSPSSLF
jgi:hypothetical protein